MIFARKINRILEFYDNCQNIFSRIWGGARAAPAPVFYACGRVYSRLNEKRILYISLALNADTDATHCQVESRRRCVHNSQLTIATVWMSLNKFSDSEVGSRDPLYNFLCC